MVTESMYASYITNKGNNLSEVRKSNSEMIMNATFTGDPSYKRVYILDPDKGWHWTDAKYHQHSRQSIVADDVDYYLQFRPHEHHLVGTYVFIPNEKSNDIGFMEKSPVDPFDDGNFENIFNDGKLWMIVGKNNSNQFVRYMVLQCDWNLKWIADVNRVACVMNCYGVTRNLNSYTSGVWQADYSSLLDQITGIWVPDTYEVFKNKITDYSLSDTRYLIHDIRVMITTNTIDPKCYKVSKINEMNPHGLLKITTKQDDFDTKRDNVELMICDYYDSSGKTKVENVEENVVQSIDKTSVIKWLKYTKDSKFKVIDEENKKFLRIGKQSYFSVTFSDKDIKPIWKLSYSDNNLDYSDIDDKTKKKYQNLINLDRIGKTGICIRPGDAFSLIGKKFILEVSDEEGKYKSNIEMEVRE